MKEQFKFEASWFGVRSTEVNHAFFTDRNKIIHLNVPLTITC